MPVRGQYNKLSETDRARALGCLDAGMRSREVARRFHTSHQTINRIRQRYRQTGQFKDMPRSGRPKVTTRAEDRYIATTVARNRFVTGPQTRRRLYAVRGPGARPVSVQTVRNRIHASGFKSRVPAKKPKLTQRHKDARLTFSRAHAGWNNPQWRRVMFSDESKFYLNRVDGRKRVWRRRGERHVPATVIPTVAFQGGGVMVWAGISATAKTDLVFIDGNLNGQRYINEVLTPHVLPFLRQMPVPDPIFQDDNARPHRARIVNDFIHRNNVNRMAWPAVSPDLSCIEHAWDVLGRAVSARLDQNSTLQDLRRFLREEWARIPQQTIRRLVYSSKNRVRECRRNNGGYTHY
ncbi:MAG: transposase [Candidatus Thiodiazotropha sp.]